MVSRAFWRALKCSRRAVKVLKQCGESVTNAVDTFVDSAALCDPNPLIGRHPKMEPMAGIEPATDGLRNRCSTAELHWHPKSTHRHDASPNQAGPAMLLLLTDPATSCKWVNRRKIVEPQSNQDTKQA